MPCSIKVPQVRQGIVVASIKCILASKFMPKPKASFFP